jgi:hypothetical protein
MHIQHQQTNKTVHTYISISIQGEKQRETVLNNLFQTSKHYITASIRTMLTWFFVLCRIRRMGNMEKLLNDRSDGVKPLQRKEQQPAAAQTKDQHNSQAPERTRSTSSKSRRRNEKRRKNTKAKEET